MAATLKGLAARTRGRVGRPRPVLDDDALDARGFRTLQVVLFVAGAILMPLGLVAILLGWYGTAHAHYAYDQTTYLISGGVLGLGLIVLGGFLYFGSWIVRVNADQRAQARELTRTLQTLTALLAPAVDVDADPLGLPPAAPVLAGDGATVHRRDCPLVTRRADLHALDEGDRRRQLTSCRVCRPLWD